MVKYLILFLLPLILSATKLKIYLVDTGVISDFLTSKYLCDKGHKDFAKTTRKNLHANSMVYTLKSYVSHRDACVVDIRYYDSNLSNKTNINNYLKSLKFLLDKEPGIINLSIDGGGFYYEENKLLRLLVLKGFKISIAAGNQGINLDKHCEIYPACYFKNGNNNVRISTNHSIKSNSGKFITHTDFETKGTSYSAAATTGKWAMEIIGKL